MWRLDHYDAAILRCAGLARANQFVRSSHCSFEAQQYPTGMGVVLVEVQLWASRESQRLSVNMYKLPKFRFPCRSVATFSTPTLTMPGTDLLPSERLWESRFEFLKHRGYQLRPRYDPKHVPARRRTEKRRCQFGTVWYEDEMKSRVRMSTTLL